MPLRARRRLGAGLSHAGVVVVLALAVSACADGGSQSAGRDPGTGERAVADGSVSEGLVADPPESSAPRGEADSVPACRLRSIDEGLPQGHGGSGFDGRGAGMVEVFAGSHYPSDNRSTLQPVRLVPASALSGWAEQPVLEGLVLELLDRDGAVVHSEPVRGRLRASSMIQRWEARIAVRPAYASLRILHGGRSIAEASGSDNPPQLGGVRADLSEALRPPEHGLPSQVLFRWTACDPDADTLSQYTYYSSDGAAGYQLVDETLTRHRPDDPTTTTTTIIYDDNHRVDYRVPGVADTSQPRRYTHFEQPWNLPEGDRAHFVVVVSDGVRWSAAVSPQFEPAPHPPIYVFVREPVDGAVFRPQEEIRLRAAASGLLGRRWRDLPHSMFHWSSDIDGEITPEPPTHTDDKHLHGQVPQGLLTPGTHRITATATDDAGNTGSTTVTIEIRQ